MNRATPSFICMSLVLLIAIGCSTGPREVPQYTIQDFLATTSYSGASFSPDNSTILLSSNETGIYNAYAVPLAGGEHIRLTNSTVNSIFTLGYFPDDERFLYSSDEGGNELSHIYVQELDGEVIDLTPGEGHLAQFLGWAEDDESFYIGTNERDERFVDVYEYAASGYTRTMIYRNDTGSDFADISPDGKYIALSRSETSADSDIYLYTVQTKDMILLTEHEGEIIHAPQTFSPDGNSLYYLTDLDNEFLYLIRHDLASSEREIVLQTNWDVSYAYFSKHGNYMIVGINNDARTELRVYDTATMHLIDLPELPNAEISAVSVSRNEEHIVFYASASNIPSDLFYYDFSGSQPRQLTRSLNPNINPDDLVTGEVVRFTSFDGVEIPGILYKPHQAGSNNKVPALVDVHGGPGGQSRIGYSALTQYLVNHGYAIFEINNRGSSGYGKTFFHMDDKKHGEGDLDDCVSSKGMLTETGYVDPDKIGIMGGSYGGFMVLAALAFRPEEFTVGVDIFGVANWVRTLENIPPWWESFRKALEDEMGDFDNMDYFRSISPLFHAENIVKPLMVLQGANDPRVLKIESDEMVEAVRTNSVPVEYVIFGDEGHGFMKNKNRERGYKGILDFLDVHLKGNE